MAQGTARISGTGLHSIREAKRITVTKQTSVMSRKHLSRLKGYLDWNRGKALAHDTLNIIDEDRWFE